MSNPLGTKTKTIAPLDVPKLPPKSGPLGLSTGKSPLGGPLGVPSSTTQKASLNVPTMPSISPIGKDSKKSGKKSLFDD